MNSERKNLVELQRSRFQEEIDEVCAILDENKIPYKLGTDGAIYDLSQVGVGGDPQTIISVPNSLFDDARVIMGKYFLKTPLQEDHYLHSFRDEELIDLLATESDWSPHDVAHARRMFIEKGLSMGKVEVSKEEHEGIIAYGKTSPQWMTWVPIIFAALWLFTTLSGVGGMIIFVFMSLGISWSVMSMKAKHPYNHYHLYDLKGRELAKKVFYVTMILSVISIILFFSNISISS